MMRNIEAVENIEALTPDEFKLDKFKAKRTATVANVETLQSAKAGG
jgi:hypothetical protein